MSLVLVGDRKGLKLKKIIKLLSEKDRKGIRPKNLHQITDHGMYFPSTPLPSSLSLLLSEEDMVGWC